MSREKFIKATRAEKIEYASRKPKPKHPLKGWLDKNGVRTPVEDEAKENKT